MRKIFVASMLVLLALMSACNNKDTNNCTDITPVTNSETYFWQGLDAQFAESPTTGNKVAIACHNCYINDSADVLDTYQVIEAAIEERVDIIELDIVIPNGRSKQAMVSHELASKQVSFEKIVDNSLLRQSDVNIFLEVKGKIKNKQSIRNFLDVLMKYKSEGGEYEYFNQNRMFVLRSFEYETTLYNIREVLTERKYQEIISFIKLSRIHYVKAQDAMLAEIEQAHECGMSMVELDYHLGEEQINVLNDYAESLGLGVSVYTFDEYNYKEGVSALKNNIEVMTVDSSTLIEDANLSNSLIEKVRQLILQE
ncbi:hypothetical protein [Thalassotalea sp. G2M2-11]|uniref:hypothetical protein n=1 Tax=Thalassotalea sp. G2M2-11 TaxID=2787627 RepID=UPI0019D0F82F|nr:hypothetical protein [Thalassotalea sp. G2M2-11]